MKIYTKKSVQQFLPLSEAEIQGLHRAQANLRYFLAWFQSLQLPSTQSESPLAPKSHVSFKVCTKLWTEFLIFSSGLTVTGITRVYCIRIINWRRMWKTACSTHGKRIKSFIRKAWKNETPWKIKVRGGRIKLKWVVKDRIEECGLD
jgi:hypothetical protein